MFEHVSLDGLTNAPAAEPVVFFPMEFHYLHGVFSDLYGPEGGDVSSLLWSPAVPGRLWCGTVSGELYFRDAEACWERVEPPFRPMMKIEFLEATTGARPSLLVLSRNGNLSLSTDNGRSWITDFPELTNERIRVIRHHRLHPGYVLAGSQTGLFFSPDSGRTWGRFPDRNKLNAVTAIAFDGSDPLVFFLSDTDGFNARVLMTTNGGSTFEPILEGEEYFNHIHSLLYQDASHSLWAAGTGFSWRVARASIDDEITWIHHGTGLPVAAITSITGTSDDQVILGSNGGGLYRFSEEKGGWKRIDIEPRRRYVRCVAGSPWGLAAGFSENGVAMENNGEWNEENRRLYARNISRIQRFGDELLVVADEQLFLKFRDTEWKTVPGFQLVQDVLAHGENCYTSGLYSGIFHKKSGPGAFWKDLNLPVSRATLVRTSSTGDLFVMTLIKRDRIRFFRYTPDSVATPWCDCSQDFPFSGMVYDFAVDQPDKTLFITISTSRGIFCHDSYTGRWTPSQMPETVRVPALFRSRHRPDVLYAAAGRNVIRSFDFGRSFETLPLAEFPSRISSLTLSGLDFESIWVSTENGGVYVSHYPDCWNALQPEERTLPINQIAVDTVTPGTMFCGTKGISCWKLSIPSLSVRTESCHDSQDRRLMYSYRNPGTRKDADIHFLLAKPGDSAFEYLVLENGRFRLSADLKPVRITLMPETGTGETEAGIIPGDLLTNGARLAMALCAPDRFHPICDIQTASR